MGDRRYCELFEKGVDVFGNCCKVSMECNCGPPVKKKSCSRKGKGDSRALFTVDKHGTEPI